jgi:hypothetical protein
MEYDRDLNAFGRRHPRHSLDLFPARSSERSLWILLFRNRLSVSYEINVHARPNLRLLFLTTFSAKRKFCRPVKITLDEARHFHSVCILVCCKMSLFI